jgi:hypothetical protein
MTMGRFDGEIQDAVDLIEENGEIAELKVMTTTDGPNDWDAGTPTEQTVDAPMAFLNFKHTGQAGGETYWNGMLVQQGDKKVLLAAAATALAPNLNALITRADGSVWKVVNMTRLDPNGQQILYTMQVRQ